MPNPTHYQRITQHTSPTPARPDQRSPERVLWAYIEWLEEHLAFSYDAREEVLKDLSRERRSNETNWRRWMAARQALKDIEAAVTQGLTPVEPA